MSTPVARIKRRKLATAICPICSHLASNLGGPEKFVAALVLNAAAQGWIDPCSDECEIAFLRILFRLDGRGGEL